LKLLYVSANRFHSPCDITAEDLVFWCAQSRDQADQRRTSHGEQIHWIYRCRVKLYQDLIILGGRFFYLRELQHLRWSVLCADNCFHKECSPRLLPGGWGRALVDVQLAASAGNRPSSAPLLR